MILGTSAIQQALADGAIVCDPPPARIAAMAAAETAARALYESEANNERE